MARKQADFWSKAVRRLALFGIFVEFGTSSVIARYGSALLRIKSVIHNKSKAIQLEAFHVFKIFAANPQKARNVQHILAMATVRISCHTLAQKNSIYVCDTCVTTLYVQAK